ncbi:molecular chaperone DnaK (HSP70) [Pedobacter sp. UYP30]
MQIQRKELEGLLQPIVDQTIQQLNQIMQRNKLVAKDINEILLVGGSTYIPLVKQELKATGIAVNTKLDPTTAVAVGAAYYAANKFYRTVKPEMSELSLEDILHEKGAPEEAIKTSLELSLSYSKMSKDVEEVLIAKVTGDVDGHSYRIMRSDGGLIPELWRLNKNLPNFYH